MTSMWADKTFFSQGGLLWTLDFPAVSYTLPWQKKMMIHSTVIHKEIYNMELYQVNEPSKKTKSATAQAVTLPQCHHKCTHEKKQFRS